MTITHQLRCDVCGAGPQPTQAIYCVGNQRLCIEHVDSHRGKNLLSAALLRARAEGMEAAQPFVGEKLAEISREAVKLRERAEELERA